MQGSAGYNPISHVSPLFPPLVPVFFCRAMHAEVQATFNAQEVANTVWAFAKVEFLDERLLDALARRLMHPEILETVNSQNIANTVWAFANMGALNMDLMKAVAARTMCPKVLQSFTTQEVANTAWSLSFPCFACHLNAVCILSCLATAKHSWPRLRAGGSAWVALERTRRASF